MASIAALGFTFTLSRAYRIADNGGLGSVQLVSLADARDEAARLRRIARSGGDPLGVRRRERRTVPAFKEAAKQVHAAHSVAFRNANVHIKGFRAKGGKSGGGVVLARAARFSSKAAVN